MPHLLDSSSSGLVRECETKRIRADLREQGGGSATRESGLCGQGGGLHVGQDYSELVCDENWETYDGEFRSRSFRVFEA